MTTPTAQEMLDQYLAAEQAVLAGQQVRFNRDGIERSLTLADLEWIQAGRREWQAKVDSAAAAAVRAPRIGGLGFSVARLDGR